MVSPQITPDIILLLFKIKDIAELSCIKNSP